jgi:prepilin-type processing-associated H-X9-DG protein/prepilin-type N-terminal cleavage/methylation domain-containing protein
MDDQLRHAISGSNYRRPVKELPMARVNQKPLISRKDQAAFTLIEVLIAIAIVMILAAIIFPVIGAVKENGRRTTCQSNQRQLAMGFQQYVQDYDGVYPPTDEVDVESGFRVGHPWWELIYPYVKNEFVYGCPDHPDDSVAMWFPTHGSLDKHFVDYDYDTIWFNVLSRQGKHSAFVGAQESYIPKPSTTWLLWDVEWSTPDGVDHYCRTVPKTSCGRSFTGSTLHSGGGNYTFGDGHAEWLTPEQMGEVQCDNGPLPAPFKD